MKMQINSSYGMIGGVVLVLAIGATVGFTFLRNNRGSKLLTDSLSEPLDGVTSAKIEINAGAGNLTINRLSSGESLLASGDLQYFDNQGAPVRTLKVNGSQADFLLQGGTALQSGFHFPWEVCKGAFDWNIHLNPTVSSDITAHSGGGNVRLDFAGMTITRLATDTGGGNIDVVLPDQAADLAVTASTGAGNVTITLGNATGSNSIDAKSGAGNVVVLVPGGIAVRIHTSTGMGKAIIDPRFSSVDANTYQSPDYDSAVNKVELTLKSGAGNISVSVR